MHFINKIYSDLSRALFLFLNIIIIILIRIHIFIIAMLFPHREGSRSYQLLHIVPAWCKQRGQDPLSPCKFSPLGASGVDTRTSVTIANIIVCIIITILILRFLIIDIITSYHRDDWLVAAKRSQFTSNVDADSSDVYEEVFHVACSQRSFDLDLKCYYYQSYYYGYS